MKNINPAMRDPNQDVAMQLIDAIGGIRVKSADGTMTYDNTIDSRIERLKPLIRKNIAQMLRGEA